MPGLTPLIAGPWTLDPARHELRGEGVRLPLTRAQFLVMALFLAEPGRVFSPASIVRRINGGACTSLQLRNAKAHVGRLRQALRAVCPRAAHCLRTIYGAGYCWETEGSSCQLPACSQSITMPAPTRR